MCRVSAKISYKYDDEIEEVVVASDCNQRLQEQVCRRRSCPQRPKRRQHEQRQRQLNEKCGCHGELPEQRRRLVCPPRRRGGYALRSVVVVEGRQSEPRLAVGLYFDDATHEHQLEQDEP